MQLSIGYLLRKLKFNYNNLHSSYMTSVGDTALSLFMLDLPRQPLAGPLHYF